MVFKEKPYVLLVAELIYSKICEIKKKSPDFSNINAIEAFIGTETYKYINSGKFQDELMNKLNKDNFINKENKKKISPETIRLLEIQKDVTIKQLIQFPDLYYAKNHFPLEISQRAFDHLWRMCESYELWCKETKQSKLLILNIIDQII